MPPNTFRARLISVGNLTVGGTGKTPVVAWIVNHLAAHGVSVGIALRGYGRRSKIKTPVVLPVDACGTETLDFVGDEAMLLSEMCPHAPVAVCADRKSAILRLQDELGCAVVVLDDAFQQLHLPKIMDIVCLDRIQPLGNEHVFPRGPLREPVEALARGTHFLFTKGKPRSRALAQVTEWIPKTQSIFFCEFEILGAYALNNLLQVVDLRRLKNEAVLLLSSIGNPESFVRSLSAVDIQGKHKIYPDHFLFTEAEISTLNRWIEKSKFSCILITEKDAVKLRRWSFCVPCYVIEMELFPPPEFIEELNRIVC